MLLMPVLNIVLIVHLITCNPNNSQFFICKNFIIYYIYFLRYHKKYMMNYLSNVC